jgi:hypothetical protein
MVNPMADIRPIETHYNGYRFRSRLEARWAVYFDLLHVKYEYEPEGFVVNGKCYLPDFYLPELNSYFEVKHSTFYGSKAVDVREKLKAIADEKNCFAMLCRGDPVDNDIRIYIPAMNLWTTAEFLKEAEVMDDDLFHYHKVFDFGIVAGYRYSKTDLKCETKNGLSSRQIIPFNTVYSYNCIPYEEQKRARQARFEHGECV